MKEGGRFLMFSKAEVSWVERGQAPASANNFWYTDGRKLLRLRLTVSLPRSLGRQLSVHQPNFVIWRQLFKKQNWFLAKLLNELRRLTFSQSDITYSLFVSTVLLIRAIWLVRVNCLHFKLNSKQVYWKKATNEKRLL